MKKAYVIHDWMIGAGLKGSQLVVFAYLYACIGEPTPIAELARMTGLSLLSAHTALRKLTDEGFIAVQPVSGKANTYTLTPPENRGGSETEGGRKPRGVLPPKTEGGTPIINNHRLSNNINSLSHTPDAHAREEEKQGWADEAFARRTLEALDNGGSVRDNIVRSLMRSGELTRDKLYQLYYTFEAMQRNEESSHTSDGDYRGHFVKWATIQLKEESRQAHVDAKMEERSRANRQTSWERRDEAERSHMEELARAAAARYEREKAEAERTKIN